MSDVTENAPSNSNASEVPAASEKDDMRKAKLLQQKKALEAEQASFKLCFLSFHSKRFQQALQSVRTQLRSQQRNLMIENSRLKRVWQYREKVKNGEIDDPEIKYSLEREENMDSKSND